MHWPHKWRPSSNSTMIRHLNSVLDYKGHLRQSLEGVLDLWTLHFWYYSAFSGHFNYSFMYRLHTWRPSSNTTIIRHLNSVLDYKGDPRQSLEGFSDLWTLYFLYYSALKCHFNVFFMYWPHTWRPSSNTTMIRHLHSVLDYKGDPRQSLEGVSDLWTIYFL